MTRLEHVVAIGGGFGGLALARALGGGPLRVTVVDRRNHHLFQPLLYQVATGALSPANIASPLRALFKRHQNVTSLLGEVTDVDLDARRVTVDGEDIAYDALVVASGSTQSYFGNDAWADRAPGLKTIDDATMIRRRVLLAFEQAEREPDPRKREALMTFVVVGGGPTGVEMAGALAEVAKRTLRREFRRIDPTSARVLLVEGRDRLLPPFLEGSSRRAQRDLEAMGVEVMLQAMVQEIRDVEIEIERRGEAEGSETLMVSAANVVWAAGVQASPLGARLVEQSDAELVRGGKVRVEADCSIAGRPEVFVIGDLAHFEHGGDEPLPGLAPVAMQQGRYVAKILEARTRGRSKAIGPYQYFDKGQMAVIGRSKAVAEMGKLRFSGLPAWLAWLFVHLMYVTEFENRILVLIQWGWNYVSRGRSARLITGDLESGPDDWRPKPQTANADGS
ncbi:MAG: NAD(P)/FAD-dependent oxidoreductase [Acidobacteriota bacterium]